MMGGWTSLCMKLWLQVARMTVDSFVNPVSSGFETALKDDACVCVHVAKEV